MTDDASVVSQRAGRWMLAAVAVPAMTTGCGVSGEDTQPSPKQAALARQAQLVGVAIDIWTRPVKRDFPAKLTTKVFRAAGITLDQGVQVTDYVHVRAGQTSNDDDLFQYCVTDDQGSWTTYGDETGVQTFGDAGDESCSFTGKPHPDAHFDVRLLAEQVKDGLHSDIDKPNMLVWGNGDAVGSNPKARRLVESLLPHDWTVSRVNQRGYAAHQYCLTAPDGEWYYVRNHRVEGYADTGTCQLDPHMQAAS